MIPDNIFIIGNWKSGTTFLQYLLNEDKNINNVFEFEGGNIWNKTLPPFNYNKYGNVIPKRYYNKIDPTLLHSESNKVDKIKLYKHPVFSYNIPLAKKLLEGNTLFISSKRNIYANIYSLYRDMTKSKFNYMYGLIPPYSYSKKFDG